MNQIILKSGREYSLTRRHPWVYSGAIAKVEGAPRPGETVPITDAQKNFLAYGAYSPDSQIALRAWSFDEAESIDKNFFERKLHAALGLRQRMLIPERTDAYRLCASEADGLPGVTIDCYGDCAVVQLSSAGADFQRENIVSALQSLRPWQVIFERSDLAVRAREGLPERVGVLAGKLPAGPVVIHEDGRQFYVDMEHGHKTGFYCDQRESRSALARFARDAEVLNLFSYTGGFGVAAALGGAKYVENVDSSAPSLAVAAENFALNQIAPERFRNVEADAFSYLRRCRGEQRKFDIVVLDPPKLVESMKALPRGTRAYKDAMLQAFYLLKPGGLLFTFSCSGLVTRELFAKIAADAACDAHCDARIVGDLGAGSDHPVPLAFPEARYLKGLIIWRAE